MRSAPGAVHFLLEGSYSSADVGELPPAWRTRPSLSSMAIRALPRSTEGLPVSVHTGPGVAVGTVVDGLEPPPVRRKAPPSTSAPISAAVARRRGIVIVRNLHGTRIARR